MRRAAGRLTLILAITLLLGPSGAAATMPQSQSVTSSDTGWSARQPLTGQAIPCQDGTIKGWACQNVELLAWLPAESLGLAKDGSNATGDLWGWHDSTTGREFAILSGK